MQIRVNSVVTFICILQEKTRRNLTRGEKILLMAINNNENPQTVQEDVNTSNISSLFENDPFTLDDNTTATTDEEILNSCEKLIEEIGTNTLTLDNHSVLSPLLLDQNNATALECSNNTTDGNIEIQLVLDNIIEECSDISEVVQINTEDSIIATKDSQKISTKEWKRINNKGMSIIITIETILIWPVCFACRK